MTFWKVLRWLCALLYIAIVTVAWLGSAVDLRGTSDTDPEIHPAPVIVR